MKQLLLICAVVALVGCGGKPLDPILDKAVRSELKKPTGELTQVDLEKVKELDLDSIGLTELPKGLENLTQLKELWLGSNQLTDVTGLHKLDQLTDLHLNRNQLTDVKGLERLTKLKALYLSNNQLTSLKGLEKLTQLTHLSLDSNQLTKVPEELEKLPSLSWLFIRNNPDLTKAQIDELQKALPNCQIVSDHTK